MAPRDHAGHMLLSDLTAIVCRGYGRAITLEFPKIGQKVARSHKYVERRRQKRMEVIGGRGVGNWEGDQTNFGRRGSGFWEAPTDRLQNSTIRKSNLEHYPHSLHISTLHTVYTSYYPHSLQMYHYQYSLQTQIVPSPR